MGGGGCKTAAHRLLPLVTLRASRGSGVHIMATRKQASKSSSSKSGTDAIRVLTTDHEQVKQMFEEYDELVESEAEDDERQMLAEQICEALTAHATIEEEIFYPAARGVLDEQDLLDEAEVEHASAKDLIAQIQSMEPADELYDAKVKVLGEYVDHHVQEEEGEMFPKVRESGLDLDALGEELVARKQELVADVQSDSEADA
jgi:hemerythrin superfamily protein